MNMSVCGCGMGVGVGVGVDRSPTNDPSQRGASNPRGHGLGSSVSRSQTLERWEKISEQLPERRGFIQPFIF